jgi:hypothetical protein
VVHQLQNLGHPGQAGLEVGLIDPGLERSVQFRDVHFISLGIIQLRWTSERNLAGFDRARSNHFRHRLPPGPIDWRGVADVVGRLSGFRSNFHDFAFSRSAHNLGTFGSLVDPLGPFALAFGNFGFGGSCRTGLQAAFRLSQKLAFGEFEIAGSFQQVQSPDFNSGAVSVWRVFGNVIGERKCTLDGDQQLRFGFPLEHN